MNGPMLNWKRVQDEVPDNDRLVICWIKGEKVGFGIYTDKLSKEYNSEKRFVVYDYVNENVIAWADFNKYPE